MRRFFLPVAVVLASCSSKSDQPGPTPDPDTGVDELTTLLGEGPAPQKVDLSGKCDGVTGGGKLAFVKKTDAWDLDQAHLDVHGNHLQAIDLDDDGYPDLLVQGGPGRIDPKNPKSAGRVLMNRPKPGGGRHFVDETVASGFGAVRPTAPPADGKLRSAQLVVAADVDGDGDLDLFSGANYSEPTALDKDLGDRNEILLNDGKGKFTLAPLSDVQKVPGDVLPPTTSATFADVDRDGIPDLFVGFWYRSYGGGYAGVQARLFKGLGDGTFKDGTPGSGLETQNTGFDAGLNHRPAYGVTSCDLDGDGYPELLVSAYGRQSNLLYKNLGGTAFQELGQASGFAGDANIDYSDNEFYRCYCANEGAGKCPATIPKPKTGCSAGLWNPAQDAKPWRNNGNTFTTTCGDLNGDGKPDLYSAEIKHWHIGQSSDASELLVNDGPTDAAPIHFTRPGRPATGLDWKHVGSDWNEGGIMVAHADLDLDGLDDLIVAASDYPDNYALVYRQKHDAPGTFEEVGESIGLHHPCTVGLAIADFDRDGDLDVIVGSSTARDCAKIYPNGNEVHFYENTLNDGPQKNGFVQIALRGKGKGGANGAGIGARVRVVVDDKGTPRVITKELTGGYGHFGMQHDTALTFGLGASCSPKAVEIRWPDAPATVVRLTGVGGGRRLRFAEGNVGAPTDLPK